MKYAFHEMFFRNFFKLFTAFMIIALFIYILSPFLVPFLFGGMLALALSPFLTAFMRKYNWSKKKGLSIMSLVMFFIGALPLTIFLMRGTRILSSFLHNQSQF